MALVLANRVQETATPNTTVSFTLTGAVSGFQTFAVIGNTNTTYYSATDSAGNWEVGEGTYSTTGPTLTRTTVYASSNSGSAVTFPGTVNVFVTYPSGKSVNLDGSGNVSALGTVTSGTWQGSTVGVAYGGTGQTSYTNGQLLIGNSTGNTLTKATLTAGTGICIANSAGSITISSTASVACATPTVAGKVFGKTQTALVGGRVALGYNAGLSGQGCNAIAIGVNAGSTNQPIGAIAVGANAAAVSSCPFLIFTAPVAVGCNSYARDCGVAVGYQARAGSNSVAIGPGSGIYCGGPTSSSAVTIGAGTQAYNSVGAVALGNFNSANCAPYGVSIGYGAFVNAPNSIVINATGSPLCTFTSNQTHIAPIRSVCSTSGLTSLFYNACTKEVVQAAGGGGGVCCATPTVAGKVYGKTEVNCTSQNTTLGFQSNVGGSNGTAVGFQATTFGSASVAIGSSAYTCFGACGAVAVGYQANSVASNGIAIGRGASAGNSGIAIGAFTTASAGSIVLNATGSAMPCVSPSRTYINPITYTPCSIGLNTLYYCGFTKEVFNGPAAGGGGVCCATPTVAGKVYGRTDTVCGGGNTGLGNGINFGFANACNVVIGNSTTFNRFGGTCNVVIGAGANACCYAVGNVLVGKGAFVYCSALNAVAVGKSSVANSYGVSIGVSAVSGQNYNVAIGSSAYSASCSSIAIGRSASASFCMCFAPNAVAIGPFASTNGANTVAIGSSATTLGMAPFVSDGAIAIGNAASAGYQNAIAIGNGVTASGSNQTHIKPIRNAAGPFTLRYDPTTGEITYN